MDGPASRIPHSSTLFSIVYLSLLAFLVSAAVWGIWSWIFADGSANDGSPTFGNLELRDAPTTVRASIDVQRQLRRDMTPAQAAELVIEKQLKDLERFVRDKTTGIPTIIPTWATQSFSGVGVDPQKISERMNDAGTQVSRYIQSDSAPVFKNKRAFEQFVVNAMVPLADCKDIKVNLRLENLNIVGNKVQTTVLAVAAGTRPQTKEGRDSSGKRQLAIQSTAIWQMTWTNVSSGNDKFRLDKITTSAAEIVSLNLNSPRLFVDCSASILADCKSLNDQLAFGLDQWASKLPGIDVSGKQGIAIGDVNGDRLDDIYVCQPRGLPNLLLVQNKDATAKDNGADSHTDLLDESRAALFIDIDNDGDQDLAVATTEALVLFSNDGKGRFQLENELPIARRGVSLSAADFDSDGDLDLFVCRTIEQEFGNRLADRVGGSSILLRNNEAFQFSRVDLDTGLPEGAKFCSRAAVWHDRDLDGDQDLDVASEEWGALAFDNVDGKLLRVPSDSSETLGSVIGSLSIGDFNGDGRSDLFVANRSKGSESFVRFGSQDNGISPFYLRKPFFSNQFATASAVLDVNNDGRDDLFIGNGNYTRIARDDSANLISNEAEMRQAVASRLSIDSRQANRCLLSIGSSGFAEMSSVSGLNLPAADDARAAATTDWDHDGDMDLVVLCRSSPQIRIFINALGNRNSISFRLTGKQSNRDAVGARVELYLKDQSSPLIRSVQAGNGARSQSTSVLHFGVGSEKRVIESAVVYWPSGLTQTFTNLSVGSVYELVEGNASLNERISKRRDLKYRAAPLAGSSLIPKAKSRVMVSPRQPLPGWEVQAAAAQWGSLRLSDQRSTVVMLWDNNSESDQALFRLDRIAEKLQANNVDLVTIFLGNADLRPDEIWNYVSTFGEDFPRIKNWLSLSDAGREQLKITCGHLFAKLELPQTPVIFLVDREQKLAAIYPAGALKDGILTDDIGLLNRELSAVASETVLGGFWVGKNHPDNSHSLHDQLVAADFQTAASILEPALSEQTSILLAQQARDLMAIKQFSNAKRLCDRALKLAPANVEALLANADWVSMKTINDTAKFPVPGSALLSKAKEQYERVLELDPSRWQAATGIAKLDLMEDKVAGAKATLERFLERDSEQPEVQAMLGRICFQLKNYDLAKRHLNLAKNQRPNLPYLKGDLGYLYLVTNEKNTAALRLLREAHQQQPSDEHFFVLLAQAEFMKGNFMRAVDLYREVTELVPHQTKSKNVLAWLLATCPFEAKRDGAAALELLEPGAEDLQDKPPATLEIYAACFAELGEFDRAIKLQQQAVDRSDDFDRSSYSAEQRSGMMARLEMYRAQKPYRMGTDASGTPVAGNPFAGTEFNALRF